MLERLKTRLAPGDELEDWCLWVSMNTENDNTAVWVERKFDVPTSGKWVSENVFSIPAFSKSEGQSSPGLIVFERTPLEGVDDEIEKYVIYQISIDTELIPLILGNIVSSTIAHGSVTSSKHYLPLNGDTTSPVCWSSTGLTTRIRKIRET